MAPRAQRFRLHAGPVERYLWGGLKPSGNRFGRFKMATPERYREREDHEHEPYRLRLVGEDREPREPPRAANEHDPWAELAIAAVICFVLVFLLFPGLP
jgi:hypothetical protein